MRERGDVLFTLFIVPLRHWGFFSWLFVVVVWLYWGLNARLHTW
jgi:hypothetical protein